jgi:ABC-2 type transport system ATP-binding protein
MLDTKQLTKQFGDETAVDDISLSVDSGSVYALIGPNGSGKTTLTKLIAGLLHPTSGTATINNIDITQNPEKAKQFFGYIPDNPVIWDSMTGLEFLHFTGALYGLDQKTRERRIENLLPIFSLNGIENTAFEHYSRGNRQKFTILASLIHKPDLLLIDEPIVGLDPDSVSILESLLKDFTDDGGSIFMTTHTLPVADRVADHIGVLADGQLKASDTPETLRAQADLSKDSSLADIYHFYAGTEELTQDNHSDVL